MALTFTQEIISSKVSLIGKRRDYLSEKKNYLQTLIDEADEVLDVASSWLKNENSTNDFTFTDINKMIEDKLVSLSSTDFSVNRNKTEQESAATESLSAVSNDHPVPPKHIETSVAPCKLEMIMAEIKAMQKSISLLNASTEKLREKQLTTENCVESLRQKLSKLKEVKIEEIVTEWERFCKKQKESTELHNKQIKNIKKEIKTVADVQTDFSEKCHQQWNKMEEQKKVHEKRLKEFKINLSDVLEKVQTLSVEIYLLNNQSMDRQIEFLENKVQFIEKVTLNQLEEHDSKLEEFIRKTEDFKNVSSGSEFEKLHEFEEKKAAFEMSWSEFLQENKKLNEHMERKYNTMCQFIALRLGPLERLRDIFNEKLDVRKENMKKLDIVCNKMADLQSTFSHRETVTQGQAIGFSVRAPCNSYLVSDTPIKNFIDVITNSGNHFNPSTGVFTVPQDGLYAISLSVQRIGAGGLSLAIIKVPCNHSDVIYCRRCTLYDVLTDKEDRNTSIFMVAEMKTGEKLSLKCKCAEKSVVLSPWTVFTCVRIV